MTTGVFVHPGGVRSRGRALRALERAHAGVDRFGQPVRRSQQHTAYAIVAASGRVAFWNGMIPQRGGEDVAQIAWYRESNARPGFMNRSERRHRARR